MYFTLIFDGEELLLFFDNFVFGNQRKKQRKKFKLSTHIRFDSFQFAYVIHPNDLRNDYHSQPFVWEFPLLPSRFVRTTKFPRIGRALLDSEDYSLNLDPNSGVRNEENEDNINDHFSNYLEQRSVHFPRIGKRASNYFFEINSMPETVHMFDLPKGYWPSRDEEPIRSSIIQSDSNHRGKRNISM